MRLLIHRLVIASLILPAAALAPRVALAQQTPRPKTWREMPLNDQLVKEAMARGIDYIWSQQNKTEHHWEPMTDAQWQAYMKQNVAKYRALNKPALSDAGLRGGYTALALLGLHKAGVNPDDPRFAKAYKWLVEQPIEQTYSRAMVAALDASLNRDTAAHQRRLDAHRNWFLEGMYKDGTYGYWPPPSDKYRMTNPGGTFGSPTFRDLSNTQYGVLGMWLLSDAGVEVPDKYWKLAQHAYTTYQNKDGGWPYTPNDTRGSTHTMTLAGVATLFVVWDKLYADNCNARPDPELIKSINGGLDWLGKVFNPGLGGAPLFKNQFIAYGLYGIERVGVASGLKYFGDHNWWDEAARYALWTQRANGSWAQDYPSYAFESLTTSYMLLFFSYGSAPVVFNKLAWSEDSSDWNLRPRDLARLTTWMGRTYERLFNWQIMPISRPVSELLDAPILQISGRKTLDLTDEQKSKLRDYVLGGGLLLGDPVGNNRVFSDSFQRLCVELFPGREFTPLPADHPLMTVHFRPGETKRGQRPLPAVLGMSNGVRLLAVMPVTELGCTWQMFDVSGGRSHFEFAANLSQYVSDRGAGLIGRGASYAVADADNKPADTMTVGRVTWGGKFNWDPEPAAWKHADIRLRNDKVMSVATKELDFAQPVAAADVPIVHLTGVGEVKLADEQKKNLKAYVAGGGLLLADAAGGDSRFAESFQKLAGELFGNLVPAVPPFLKDATDGGKVTMRHVGGLPRSSRSIELLGVQTDGRWSVLFLPHDLTAALVGYANVEPVGLTPESAQQFVTELLKWRRAGK